MILINKYAKNSDSQSDDFSFKIETVNSSFFSFGKKIDRANFEMIAIPEGSFLMGSADHNPKARQTEKPQHQVTVAPFFMSKYPITQAQWRVVANLPKINLTLKPKPSYFTSKIPQRSCEDQDIIKNQWDRPVEMVNWDQAMEFCQRISQYTSKLYTLPSETQWEYACQGSINQLNCVNNYYFGNEESLLENYAWYQENSGEKTQPVGLKKPNNFGLYDLSGNVWEWCLDDWHYDYNDYYYKINHEKMSDDEQKNLAITNYEGILLSMEKIVLITNEMKVIRGGSYCNFNDCCRCAYRGSINRNSCVKNVGFRIVCSG